MSTDLVLDEKNVTVQGETLKFCGCDLSIDGGAPRRRNGTNPSAPRRALVHDEGDGLTLNFNGDYPGGVTIRGDVKIDQLQGADPPHQLKVVATDICLDGRPRDSRGVRRALVHDVHKDGLALNWGNDYPDGVTINGELKVPNKLFVGNKDVAAMLGAHEEQVKKLTDRLNDLEAQLDEFRKTLARLPGFLGP